MKNLPAIAVGALSLLVAGVSLAQSGNMMNGGSWDMDWMGGYGGMWVPILLVIAFVGVVVWIVQRKGN